MTSEQRKSGADILDEATKSLRQDPILVGPTRELLAATLSAINLRDGQMKVLPIQPIRQHSFRLIQYSGLAAAVALVAIVVSSIGLWNHSASPAFAQVVENIHKATSVSFTISSKAGDQQPYQATFFLQGDLVRADIYFDSATNAFVKTLCQLQTLWYCGSLDRYGIHQPDLTIVEDFKKLEATEINYSEKKFHKLSSKELNKDAMQELGSPVSWIKDLAQDDGELIGDEVLNGRQTHVYRLKKVDYPLGTGKIDAGDVDKVWVDAESGLPVKIIAEFFDTLNHRHTRDVYDDFQWNKPLDTRLFNLEVPEGYKVVSDADDVPKNLPPFAQIVENVRVATSVQFSGEEWLAKTPNRVSKEKYFIQGKLLRVEIDNPNEPSQLVNVIADAKTGEALTLWFAKKVAERLPVTGTSSSFLNNPVEAFANLKDEDAKFLGEEDLGKQKTQVYELSKYPFRIDGELTEGETAKLWIDPKSQLPIRLLIDYVSPSSKAKTTIVMKDFKWNEPINPKLFEMQVPEGFTKEKSE